MQGESGSQKDNVHALVYCPKDQGIIVRKGDHDIYSYDPGGFLARGSNLADQCLLVGLSIVGAGRGFQHAEPDGRNDAHATLIGYSRSQAGS